MANDRIPPKRCIQKVYHESSILQGVPNQMIQIPCPPLQSVEPRRTGSSDQERESQNQVAWSKLKRLVISIHQPRLVHHPCRPALDVKGFNRHCHDSTASDPENSTPVSTTISRIQRPVSIIPGFLFILLPLYEQAFFSYPHHSQTAQE